MEGQAQGPVLNPVEMAMPDAAYVIKVLKSIPGYVVEFQEAFPGEEDPVNCDNFGKAVGAFERTLVTPGRWDKYLKGKEDALSDEEKEGLSLFHTTGCATCHNGPAPVPELEDEGRSAVSGNETEKHFFKVSSLRNIEKTGHTQASEGLSKTLPSPEVIPTRTFN